MTQDDDKPYGQSPSTLMILAATLLLLATACASSSGDGAEQPARVVTEPATSLAPASESAAGLRFRIVAGVQDAIATQATSPSAKPSDKAGLLNTGLPSAKGQSLDEAIAWAASPPTPWAIKFSTFTCPAPKGPKIADDPDEPLLTCSADGTRYLLSKAVIDGTSLKSAVAGMPTNELDWAVSLQLNDAATSDFAEISQKLIDNKNTGAVPTQIALVLDGEVLSAPEFTSAITDGRSQISGSFNEANAKELAARLSRH